MSDVSVNAVIVTTLSGLLIGIILDVLCLRRWIGRFYTASLWLMASIYAALCVVAVAFFMGLPVGTFGLGLLAGVYAGRGQQHAGLERETAGRGLHRAALFAAALTTSAALPIGILALQEPSVVELLRNILGIEPGSGRGAVGVMLVYLFCVTLFVAQYWCSLQAGCLAVRIGAASAQQDGAPTGGSTTPAGNSKAPEGPPSVS
jgi:hypothetical protein